MIINKFIFNSMHSWRYDKPNKDKYFINMKIMIFSMFQSILESMFMLYFQKRKTLSIIICVSCRKCKFIWTTYLCSSEVSLGALNNLLSFSHLFHIFKGSISLVYEFYSSGYSLGVVQIFVYEYSSHK